MKRSLTGEEKIHPGISLGKLAFPALLFILAAAPNSFAQILDPVQGTETPVLRSLPWEINVLFAIFISLGFIALAFMFSKVFGVKELGAWANGELYQVLMMSLLVFLFFGLIKFESIAFEAYGLTPTFDHPNPAIQNAQTYLSSVKTYITFIIGSMNIENVLLSSSSKLSSLARVPMFKMDGAIDVFFKSLSEFINSIMTIMTSVYGLTTMQIYFLDAIERLAFNLILPVGIFFRIFTFTRNAGNFLIVVAISFYIVYPLTFLMNQTIVDTLLGQSDAWKTILDSRIKSNAPFSGVLNSLRSSLSDDTNSMFSLPKGMISSLTTFFEYAINSILVIFEEATFGFLLFTIIPILDFTITVVVAKELGKLFGSSVEFTKILTQL